MSCGVFLFSGGGGGQACICNVDVGRFRSRSGIALFEPDEMALSQFGVRSDEHGTARPVYVDGNADGEISVLIICLAQNDSDITRAHTDRIHKRKVIHNSPRSKLVALFLRYCLAGSRMVIFFTSRGCSFTSGGIRPIQGVIPDSLEGDLQIDPIASSFSSLK